ncbi:MAG: oligopeptide transport system permease protein [Myxococcota bacterium]|jgi:oligopeptide transport system permease protein
MINLLRRLGFAVMSVLLVHALAFFMLHGTRGGPFDSNQSFAAETLAALEARYQLNEPLATQYLNSLRGLATLDFGPSLQYQGTAVKELLNAAIPVSLILGLGALFIAVFVGLSAGLYCATSNSKWRIWLIKVSGSTLLATPNFVIAGILISIFAFGLGILPVAGQRSITSWILPCCALGLPLAAQLFVLVQHHATAARNSNAYRSALSRGLHKRKLQINYILRPSLTPVLAFLGPAAAGILTGSLVIEQIFSLPGLGTFFVQAALARDYTLALGVTVVYTAALASCTFIADILIMKFDPRNESI